MNINSSRNSLLRARNLRSARRSRAGKVINSKTTRTSRSNSNQRTTSSLASKTPTKQLAMYEQMEKSANSVQDSVEKMLKIGKKTYTDDETGKKAQENDKENLIKNIKDFVTEYNEVYNNLCDIGGASNLAFKKTLNSVVSTNKKALEEIGITVSKSGELSIDEKTLEGADFDKIKEVFAKEGGFSDKVCGKMETIENAASNITTLSKLYGATSTYNKFGTSNSYFNGYSNSGYYNNYKYGNYGSNSGWYF